jgi:transposase
VAFSYKAVDRVQQYILPPSLAEWLPEDHLVWFLIDVVAAIDTSELHKTRRLGGAGRQAYDPDMLLALMFYAYCSGERSSRKIEQRCETDVAYRILSGGNFPDHTTIARFRQRSAEFTSKLFVEILLLLKAAGMLDVGVVAIDGTRMAANASKKANRSAEGLAREAAELEELVKKMMAEAEATDADEDARFGEEARGDERPEAPKDPGARLAYVKKLHDDLKARQQERAQAEEEKRKQQEEDEKAGRARRGRRPTGTAPTLSDLEAELAREKEAWASAMAEWRTEQAAAKAAGQLAPPKPPRNRVKNLSWRITKERRRPARPAPTAAKPSPSAKVEQVNLTDPDSRLMKSPNGWVQGFNAQAAVAENGVIVAALVATEHNDCTLYKQVVDGLADNLDVIGHESPPGVILADAGYFSKENLESEGPDRLISDTKGWKLRQEAKQSGYVEGDPPVGATAVEKMHHKMRTREGAETYAKRQQTVEPAFGDIKENKGFRRFSSRGKDAVEAEWLLMCAAKNLLKLFQAQASA